MVAPCARAWQSAVFEALNFPACQQGLWKTIARGSVAGTPLGFGCAGSSGIHGRGTPNDPYRVVLDGREESIDIKGLETTTQTDYTVAVWFRVRSAKDGLVMLVDSRKDPYYAPVRMLINNGKPECVIEMPFPDRVYRARASAAIETHMWWQAVCRFRAQSRELSLFLDGTVEASTRIPPGTIRSNRIRIGENFAGDIAEVVFSARSEEASAIETRCKEESRRFAGARCR
jgi:Concanavalin A-like lectin/glucanases superfamily